MDSHLKNKVYNNLCLKDKIEISKIEDQILYQNIINDINHTWLYILDCFPYDIRMTDNLFTFIKRIQAKNEDEVLWNIFNSDYNFFDIINCHVHIQKAFGLSDGNLPYTKLKTELKENLDKEEILSKIKEVILDKYLYIHKFTESC